MTPLEEAERTMNGYLEACNNATSDADKAWAFHKAVYWSIEVDIEAYWEHYWHMRREEMGRQ